MAHILKYEHGSVVDNVSEDILKPLCSKLIQQAQCLAHQNMSPTASTASLSGAIQYLTLLCYIEWKYKVDLSDIDQSIKSPTLVEHIIHFVFPSSLDESHTHRPQWTWSNNESYTQALAEDLIQCWSFTNNNAWKLFLQQEGLWEDFVQRSWSDMITKGTVEKANILRKLFILHLMCPIQTRRIFRKVIQNLKEDSQLCADPCRRLVVLFSSMSNDVSAQSRSWKKFEVRALTAMPLIPGGQHHWDSFC